MNLDLDDRVAIVTGGGSGIGAACVREIAALGASVVVADLSQEAAEKVCAELGDRTVSVVVDVTQVNDVDEMVAVALKRFGRLDIAVNSAGVGMPVKAAVGVLNTAEWQRVTDTNLTGTFYSMRAEIPAMLSNGGCVINIASVLGSVGAANASAYVAAKHGVVGLTQTAALEYAAQGVRINAVGPGFIDTPMLAGRDNDYLAAVAAAHPLGRLGTAEEVAAVVAFLACPAASFVTGAFIPVDGGYLAR